MMKSSLVVLPWLALAWTLPAPATLAQPHPPAPSPSSPKNGAQEIQFNVPLQRKLREMAEEDQRVRQNVRVPSTPNQRRAMGEVGEKNEAIMKAIVACYGWPGRSLVGEEGANDAWIIAQHCQLEFQDICLTLLERAVASGEAPARHHAYLLDRVYVGKDWPQIYGTQFRGGALYPIKDPKQVNQRRQSVGLGPLEDYVTEMQKNSRSPAHPPSRKHAIQRADQ